MSFQLSLERAWSRASYLTGPEDLIPPGALRLLVNTRLDRSRGVIVSRPGLVRLTPSPIDGAHPLLLMVSKLFAPTGDLVYIQASNNANTTLVRTVDFGGAATPLATGLALSIISETDGTDGQSVPHKFFVGPLSKKDNGTLFSNFGIVGPVAAPASAVLGARLSNALRSFENLAAWVSSGTGALANDTGVIQEGTSSLKFTIAADTLGTVTGTLAGTNAVVQSTHTGGNGTAYLEDSTVNFLTLNGLYPGSWVYNTNVVPPFIAQVSRIQLHRLYFDAGTIPPGHIWNTGDVYNVLWNLSTLGSTPIHGTDNSGVNGKQFSLVDTTVDFRRHGVTAGMTVHNDTQGGTGAITSIGTTTNTNDTLHFTAGLTGGTVNTFSNGDAYTVHNDLVVDDDWVHLWILADFPDRIQFMVIDFGFDLPGTIASNFYSTEISPSQINGGAGQWTELYLRKSAFQRFGAGPQGWQMITMMRVRIQTTTTAGGITMWLNGPDIIGGYGIEGTIKYAAIYVNETTGCMSAPAKTIDEVAFYTTDVEVKRHPVVLNLTNITTAPDPQVTHMWIYRYGGNIDFPGTFVATVPIGTTSFSDDRADVQLDTTRLLEVDNDPPPSDVVRLFGPGAQQRLFGFHKRNLVRYSKQWEVNRSRLENWPATFEFQVGDGAETIQNGIAEDQSLFIYTNVRGYEILGQGPDAYLPVPIPESRPLAAPLALTSGDGLIFLLVNDGIYAQVGRTQQKLTGNIDPFFLGETVDGQLPMATGALAACVLTWYHHPTDPEVVLLYPEQGSTTPNKRLVLKKNPQTGQYTDCYFDSTAGLTMRSAYVDPRHLMLIYGGDNGHLYQAEVGTSTTDDVSAILARVRGRAMDDGQPQHIKTYADAVVEVNTGGSALDMLASFNRSRSTFVLGPVSSVTDDILQRVIPHPLPPSQELEKNIALDLTWLSTQRVTIFSMGHHAQIEGEALTFFDTGPLTFPLIEAIKLLAIDIDTPGQVQVALFVDGLLKDMRPLFATAGRQRVQHYVPAGMKGREIRVTLTALTLPLLLYSVAPLVKPWGKPAGYQFQALFPAG